MKKWRCFLADYMKIRIWSNIYMIVPSFTTVGQTRCRSWLR